MRNRCSWAKDEPNITYHDKEWGVPKHDDKTLFEFLILEGAQAGLSWITILKRRSAYHRAFSGFDATKVSRYSQRRVQKLLEGDSGIIRNKLKINSAINNAKQFLKIQSQFGSFDSYVWGFVNHVPIKHEFKHLSDIPATSTLSEELSKDLKRRGFTFVGPIICYAFMQAIGMVNDHTTDCFRHNC